VNGEFYDTAGTIIDPIRRDKVFTDGISQVDSEFATGRGSSTLARALATASTQRPRNSTGVGLQQPAPASLTGILYSQASHNAKNHSADLEAEGENATVSLVASTATPSSSYWLLSN
jgi:hypothetical protein